MRLNRMRNYYPGCIYHIFNRGNNKQNIFKERSDYIFYIIKLRKCLYQNQATLFSYCLMPNHIHLEIKQSGNNSLGSLIGSLHTSYANYFNNKYKKIGHLFQGRYKAKEVRSENQFLELVFYIHVNPVLAKMVSRPENWEWSSARDYAGLRNGTLCNKTAINVLGGTKKYNEIMDKKIQNAEWKYINNILLD